jgi:hypothetical protein
VRLIDSTLHRWVPGLGVGKRWLREQLAELHVKIPLSDGCLQELASDAQAAAWRHVGADLQAAGGYLACLRHEIERRAHLVQFWTTSDESLDEAEEAAAAFVRIARRYALPRPWKLTEPVAALCPRPRPSYWRWASETAQSAQVLAEEVAGARAG